MASLSALSTEYVRYQVTASLSGNPYNPTTDVVSLAFPAVGVAPVTNDWHTGSWETIGSSYFARLLIGPANSGTVYAAGTYDAWVRITDSPEIPARKVGTLTIT